MITKELARHLAMSELRQDEIERLLLKFLEEILEGYGAYKGERGAARTTRSSRR